jgi:hypothetical protein
MLNITIGNEPYSYYRVNKRLLLVSRINRTRYTIVNVGDYIILDRWFNCGVANEKQMSQLIRADYEKFKRSHKDAKGK